MNKYAARGILLDAIEGKRILVLTVGVHEVTHVLGELNEQLGDSVPARCRRAGGSAGIEIAGSGRVKVQSWRQSLRGIAFDVIYLDTGVDAELRSLEKFEELRNIIVSAPTGEIIRA